MPLINLPQKEPPMARKIKDLTPREVLALAVRLEQANALRLRNFALAFQKQDPGTSARFDQLAREEDLHEEWLQAKYRKMFGSAVPPAENLDVEGLEKALEWDDADYGALEGSRGDRVFRQALEAEQKARNFYLKAKRSAKSKALAKLFAELAEMEQGHTGWLAEKIEAQPVTGFRKVLDLLGV